MVLLNSKEGLIKAKRSALTPILDLPFNGANNSTSFTDIAKGKAISRQNTIISTAQSVSGGSSAFFDGVSWLSTPDHPDFNFGTGSFSINLDCWIGNSYTNSTRTLIGKSNGGSGERYILSIGSNNKFIFSRRNAAGTSLIYLESQTTISLSTWYNVKASRSGDVSFLAINNTIEATANAAGVSVFGDGLFTIGYLGFAGFYFNGYLDNLRIEKA
ncbi:LamG-like jellyroll fold domain-containing protein [Anabaena sp. CCY 9910]|uniref:LamG-like jellyroll fold domain-containing protein n=1 Tax=Anabaena sp. CCY 9910 TaxID=3103870 RepID=UPI0039E0EA0B